MPDQPLVVMPAVGGRSSVDTAIGDGSHRRRRRARGGAMRVGSGPAVGGSLGSVHKKCPSSATLMKIDNPRRKLVVEQFVTTSPGNVTIATTAIAIVLFQVAANNIDPSKLAHGEQKSLHAHVEGEEVLPPMVGDGRQRQVKHGGRGAPGPGPWLLLPWPGSSAA